MLHGILPPLSADHHSKGYTLCQQPMTVEWGTGTSWRESPFYCSLDTPLSCLALLSILPIILTRENRELYSAHALLVASINTA